MHNSHSITLDIARCVVDNAERLHAIIATEETPGESAFQVALIYDLLDSELRHLKDRYDVHYQNSMEEAMPGPPSLLQRSNNG